MGIRAIAFILLIVAAGILLFWPKLEGLYDSWQRYMNPQDDEDKENTDKD